MNAQKPIPDLLNRQASEHGEALALISAGLSLTYRELNGFVAATAAHLKAQGISPQDRVAIIFSNCPEYVILLLALWRLKAIPCLLSPRLPGASLLEHLQQMQCRAVFASGEQPLSKSSPGCLHLPLIENVRRQGAGKEFSTAANFEPDSTATLLLTSGTSSRAKVVVHSFANHYFSALGANEHIPLAEGDRWMLSLPLYHVSGLSILFRVLVAGAALVIPHRDEKNLFAALSRHPVTHISVVAAQLLRMSAETEAAGKLKTLKAILLGGGPVPEVLCTLADKYLWPLYTSYGLTEMSSQVATTACRRRHTEILKYREVTIAGDGEILVRGETRFSGYWQEGRMVKPFLPGGWFPTGDVGYLDEKGLHVEGRKDDMFVSGGENIHPQEVETALLEIPGVLRALVVALPDTQFGSRPVAFLQVVPGTALRSQAVIESLGKVLPRFKIPKTFYHWPGELLISGIKPVRRDFVRYARDVPLKLQPLE